MASVNKVILVGNLGRDPEVRHFPDGGKIANVTIATTDRWKDKQTSEQRESTEWHRLVFNGALAGIVESYLKKGAQIYVEGSLKTRKYTDKDGVEKYTTEVRVNQMQMLGSKGGMAEGQSAGEDGGESGGSPASESAAPAHSEPAAGEASAAPKVSEPAAGEASAAPKVSAAKSDAPKVEARASSGFDDMDDDIPF